MTETLVGSLERITYRAEDTGYTVAQIRPHARRGLITAVGRMPGVQPGELLHLEGAWVEHRAHGRQFEVVSFRTTLPDSSEGIMRYLASGLLPGIGPVTAQRIVDVFGPSTLDVLDTQPERLREVKGLGTKKIAAIISAWEQERTIKTLLELGQDVGLAPTLAIRIFRQYGAQSAEIVRSDPYRLALDVDGISFPTADRIAQTLGIDRDAPGRLTAGLRYTLSLAAREDGHCALPAAELVPAAAATLELSHAVVAAGLEEATAAVLLVRDGDLIYLPALYYAEQELAQRLLDLQHSPSDVHAAFQAYSHTHIHAALEEAGFDLSAQQTLAVHRALTVPVCVLTGGPGTGKTTTIRALLLLLQHQRFRVALAAPTGRAARRLAETTSYPATTIHRLLEYSGSPGIDRWGRNEAAPLDVDMVIIDEASMLDVLLAHHLLKAVRRSTHILFVGDADQLPSVGPGAVLRDLLAAPLISRVHLSTIFRQSADSGIIANAHAINRGELPEVDWPDFFWFPRAEPPSCAEMVVDLVTRRIPRQFPHLDPHHDVQVLAATHRGPAGVAALNELLQATLNPPHPERAEAVINSTLFRVGDRVIQLRNNYELDVSNGDLGILIELDSEERSATIQYDHVRTITYTWSEMDEVALAYAISVHKAQGGEYPAVVIPLLRYYGGLLNRPLLYTAVTRARELVVLTGDLRALERAVESRAIVERTTGLAQRLQPSAT